ncbi:fasciculation and elongation protein zeta-2 [Tetranychus urticae]|uniref:Fasciculation and elongation protein zeta-2 n=1 Tax=Tetranychus urticae TaxID=32264 RepID=T1KJV6_TETUR|nr:fasciculation and elongation protein zeta-2 [Tetranychus urticae]
MSELKCEAPLAAGEDWPDFIDYQGFNNKNNQDIDYEPSEIELENNRRNQANSGTNCKSLPASIDDVDSGFLETNFKETISGSLEDLVNTFDEKITKCFHDYEESVEKLAPVQVRAQEDIINDSQMWWTLTGNFGNILPVDWSQSYARKLQLPSLKAKDQNGTNINCLNSKNSLNHGDNILGDTTLDEEDLAKDLDLHSLILSSLHQEPIFTAEQVLEEIDKIMQETSPTDKDSSEPMEEEKESSTNRTVNETDNGIRSLIYREKLEKLTITQLNELYIELERMIQGNSETLIQELALRDELEFEKELKNTFISLLLGIQNKRRKHHLERKKGKSANEPKYLTTVIPYNPADGPPDVRKIQILIKILKAVNEDSPTVPTLLTDFILKVLCPT